MTSLPAAEPIESFHLDEVVCHEAFGWLLKHCTRKAA
jgi:hypothetical protein